MLATHTDYRLVYYCPKVFCDRVRDYVSSKQDLPRLDRMLDDMWDVMAEIMVISDPTLYSTEELQQLKVIFETGDPELAAPFVCDKAGPKFVELFQRDLVLYLHDTQIGFFSGQAWKSVDRYQVQNAPVLSVW